MSTTTQRQHPEPTATESVVVDTTPCALDGCMYIHTADSTWTEHDWHDSVEGRSLGGDKRPVTVWASVCNKREPVEIMVSVADGEDSEAETWLTISDAEYLIYALGSAIRRVTTYRDTTPAGRTQLAEQVAGAAQ